MTLVYTPTLLAAASELAPSAAPVRFNRRLAAPTFEPVRIASPDSEPEAIPAAPTPRSLLKALASKTDQVIEAGVWGERLELRSASSHRACPTAQIERAETALGGEAISTAFDGRVRRFVEDVLTSRPASGDLAPQMAHAVDALLPNLQPALARTFTSSGPAHLLGEDARGRDVYLVRHAGQDAYVLVAVDDDGRIETALFCVANG